MAWAISLCFLQCSAEPRVRENVSPFQLCGHRYVSTCACVSRGRRLTNGAFLHRSRPSTLRQGPGMNPELPGSPWSFNLVYYTSHNILVTLRYTVSGLSASCVATVFIILRKRTVKKHELDIPLKQYVITSIVLMGPSCSGHGCPS